MKYLETNTYNETSKVFVVSLHALRIWKRKVKNNESLELVKRENYSWKICPEALTHYIEKYPDKYQHKIVVRFGCTQQVICIPRKKER